MVADMPVQLTVQLPRSASTVCLLRRMVRLFLLDLKAPKPVISDVELIVGELAANVVRHATGSDSYAVQIAVSVQRITVTVMDQGRDGLCASALPFLPAPGTLRPENIDHREDRSSNHSERRQKPEQQPEQQHDGHNRPEEPMRLGGWGLPLVRSLCDRFEVGPNQPQGTTVRAEKQLVCLR